MKLQVDGKHRGLPIYEERLFYVKAGSRTTLVARIMVRDDAHGHICQSELYGQKFRFRGSIEPDTTDVTLLNVMVNHYRHPILEADEHSAVLQHKARKASDYMLLMETCSGLGGLGVGAEFAGWKVVAQNDLQKKFTDHQNQFGKVPNVTGSIAKLRTIQELHNANSKAASMAFGYACQPFSALGDGRQGDDPRAATLPFSLVASYLLKKEILVLECVTNAATSSYVQQCVQYHLDMVRGTKAETILELGDVWISKRRRYWTVILKEFMGKVTLRTFPKMAQPPTLSCVLPDIQTLPAKQMDELRLTDAEYDAFSNFGKGMAAQMVDLAGQGGTALHSWGNQIHECACGCRPGLSHARLKQHGLYGALVCQNREDGTPCVRHLSPVEMSIMNGLVKEDGWHDEQRLLTAGIGQLASPLQSAWVFAHIRNHLSDMGFHGLQPIAPKEVLGKVIHAVLQQRDKWFPGDPTCAMIIFQEEMEQFLFPKPTPAFTDSQEDRLLNAAANACEAKIKEAEQREKDSALQAHLQVRHDTSFDQDHPGSHGQDGNPFAHHHRGVGDVGEPATPQDKFSGPFVQDRHADGWVAGLGNRSVVQDHPGESLEHPRTQLDTASQASREPTEEVEEDAGQSTKPNADEMTHISPSMGKKFPGDELTGALDAFRPQPEQSAGNGMRKRQADENEGKETFANSLRHVNDKQSQVNKADASSEQAVKVTCQAEEIAQRGVIMWDIQERQVSHFRHVEGTTAEKLQQAMHALTNEDKPWCTAVGTQLQPLDDLPNESLLLLGKPMATHARDIACLEDMLVGKTRLEALIHQGGAVAVDEMEFYMKAFAMMPDEPVNIIPPLVIDELMDVKACSQPWIAQFEGVGGVSMILWKYHWIPVKICVQLNQWEVTTTWEGVVAWEQLSQPDHPTVMLPIPAHEMQFMFDCGFQAFAWLLAQHTGGEHTPMTDTGAAGWRRLFWQQILMHPHAQPVRLGGHGELETALQAVLREHGVPTERVHDRMQQVITNIGNEKLIGVFRSTRPWQALKHLANTCSPKLRLVTEDELQTVIKDRTRNKKPVATQKVSGGPKPQQFHVAPEDVHIPSGIFCQEGGDPLAQIVAKQFHAGTAGVAVMSEQEVQPYLHQGRLSDVGLGFLILAPYSEEAARHGESIRFPASSVSTGEPMLLSAILVQKGGRKVYRNTPGKLQAVSQVMAHTVKLIAYRDQIPLEWGEFSSQQVRHILEWFPVLRKCIKEECGCPQWHPVGENKDGPILDLWQRDHLTAYFKPAKIPHAQIFVCLIRVVDAAFQTLFHLSGTNGVYFEPRTPDGMAQDGGFQTIWLGKQTLTEAKATQSVLGERSSLVRVNTRFGVKVPAERAQAIHEKLKPSEPFFQGGTRSSYRVGPMPWGCTKHNMQTLFSQWGWAAKPVQPAGRSADNTGLMWQVFATNEPPSQVYTMQHGDVVIHKDEVAGKQVWQPPQAQASSSMISKYRKSQEGEFDPWAAAASKLPPRAPNAVEVTSAHLASLDVTIDQKIQEKVQAIREDSDDPMTSWEPRMQMLEQQMAQMQADQQGMQQQATTFEKKLDYLNHQVETQGVQFASTLDTKLGEQMARIEALIAKRKLNE